MISACAAGASELTVAACRITDRCTDEDNHAANQGVIAASARTSTKPSHATAVAASSRKTAPVKNPTRNRFTSYLCKFRRAAGITLALRRVRRRGEQGGLLSAGRTFP